MSAEPTTDVVHVQREPIGEVVKEVRPAKYQFTVLFVALCVLIFVMITTVTGQWLKHRHTAHDDTQDQWDLWSKCQCQDSDAVFQCGMRNKLFRATAGISVIAVGSQFIAITAFLLLFTRLSHSRGLRIVGVIFAWLAAVTLLVTWALFAGNFNQRYCSTKIKQIGDLHWAFGLRVAEFVLWTIVAVLFTMYGGRPAETKTDFLRVTLLLAIFIFTVSIATTTGRGWVIEDNDTIDINTEVSLWETCSCVKSQDFQCKETRRLFRAQEGFAIISIGVTFLLILIALFDAIPRFVHIILAFLSFASILITWVVYSQFYSQGHCGTPKPSLAYKYYWPFGLNVCAFIIMVVLFVVTIVGAAKKFN